MLGTNSAFASAGVVLAGRDLVRDGDDGERGYGLRTAEEARARAYVEAELKRRRGESVEDDAEACGGTAKAGAGGDDNRGAESWLTAIEEVDVSLERRMQNIEETERAKRAMLDGARPGEIGEFDALRPSHMELKEAKKRPPPSETALARRQFVTGFGAKRERQEASEESRREKERRKNFFKKKRNKR
jgi:deoxyribodipyrimidine photo-lyase